MEKISQVLSKIPEDQFSLTNFDYPMILTEEEKLKAVEWARTQIQKHNAWKISQFAIMATSKDISKRVDPVNIVVDEEAIIIEANMRKHWKMEEIIRNEERIKEDAERLQKDADRLKQFDANYFFRLLKRNAYDNGKELLMNEHTAPYIKKICYFMADDSRFETELNLSLKKGLWIRGISGLGKTFVLQNVADNEKGNILIKNIIEIIEEIRESGEFRINQQFSKFMIDDLATEQNSVVKHYGTDINWGKDFIERYYLNTDKYNKLIVTTNANFDEIEKRYGFRVRSRLKDMFNIIDVSGVDMRG